VLFEGVCEGPPPLACDDLSRDSIVLGGELSYGECLEGCRSTLLIAATSLNRSLWFAMGETTGIEARGKNNDRSRTSIYQGLTRWAPNVTIFRDPRWGRGEETPGEDPTINGEYAVSFVSGMQGPPSGKYVRAAACLIELKFLEGRKRLPVAFDSLVQY
jgi:hypothetical protein